MEARGNGPAYPAQYGEHVSLFVCSVSDRDRLCRGVNYVRGSLNWGPLSWLNAVSKTYGWWTMRRSTYADTFHTYAVEWTEDFM